ncbi:MAG: Smr/MutS family protein, partial [Gemmatimonadaceae bacterium]
AALEALVELDSLVARARFAEELGCAPADFSPARLGFAIRDGRHPLLLARGGAVVPFDLAMGAGERTLLLSGPNTGGKTVLLKAIGLISALAQSGIPAPVGAESVIPIFDDCFADIGDEQSIEASLSTFSAHVRNLGEILARATASSLVLVDELGSGTDPTEGAALGAAILEELTRRGTLTVATTHLGALKLLATETPAIVNASLQFDEAALAPTYRLIKGIPGRSYGLSIARRLNLPNDVLERATERLPRGERDVAALLTDLERREAELNGREATAKLDAERAAAKLERVAERERKVRATERELEKEGRQDARRYLLDARAEVDRIIKSLKTSTGAMNDAARRAGAPADELEREARRQVETLAGEQGDALEQMAVAERKRTIASSAPATAAIVGVGDVVEVATLGGKAGRVVEMRGDAAVVAVGAMKLTLPTATLRRTSRKALEPEVVVELRGDLPELDHAPSEVDLRGMRVDEMESALVHFIDTAIRADLAAVRIIHGKGTGALRLRVQELLRAERRVRAFRMGAWNEGGAGVTIAELA